MRGCGRVAGVCDRGAELKLAPVGLREGGGMSGTFPFELGRFFRQSDPLTSRKSVTKTNRMRWGSQ
ncbi:MAG: hypothetical protein ACK55I_20620, partial [bacterium]